MTAGMRTSAERVSDASNLVEEQSRGLAAHAKMRMALLAARSLVLS